jgi:hypothetical protein
VRLISDAVDGVTAIEVCLVVAERITSGVPSKIGFACQPVFSQSVTVKSSRWRYMRWPKVQRACCSGDNNSKPNVHPLVLGSQVP